jgi:ABC-type transport system involved in multi-copper enzyme maturation permease subunit
MSAVTAAAARELNWVISLPRRLASVRGRLDWPVLTQEMRIRQRGAKPFYIMMIYAAVLCVVVFLAFVSLTARGPTIDPYTMAERGRLLFASLLYAQLAMIALIVPAYSAGAVSTERERGTIELLSLTLLSSSGIVVQKLAAAVAQAVMLVLVSLPITSIVFMFGGVSPLEVAAAYLLLVLTAGMIGALGIFCSCQFRTTRGSTFTTYLSILVFLAGVPVFGGLLGWMASMNARGTTFCVTVVAAAAFAGAVIAVTIYFIASAILRRKWRLWSVRIVRMWTFGAVYALVLLLLVDPTASDRLICSLYSSHESFFLPLYVNPFAAAWALVTTGSIAAMGSMSPYATGAPSPFSGPHGGYYGAYGIGYGPVVATMVFAAAAFYLFKHLATFRFEATRRA